MERIETIDQYYADYSQAYKKVQDDVSGRIGDKAHFNIIRRLNCYRSIQFMRRDYYKIVLTRGKAKLMTEKGEVFIDKPALFFSDRNIRFGWENLAEYPQGGYTILFNEYFINSTLRNSFRKLFSLFKNDIYPFIFLTEEQYGQLMIYCQLIEKEHSDCFGLKDDILRDLLNVIIYSGIKIKAHNSKVPSDIYPRDLASRFLELLEQQFPVDDPEACIALKAPSDYAEQLHVHVNYLNHIVKEQTGKTTSQLIQERIVTEAISLLLHSDWRIGEIAQGLGFEYPQHFNNFFKKYLNTSPKDYRNTNR